MKNIRILVIFSFLNLGSAQITLANNRCESLFSNHEVVNLNKSKFNDSEKQESAYKEIFKINNEPVKDKAKYFKDISWLIKKIIPELRKELAVINNQTGSDIEIAQVLSFLRSVDEFESTHLKNIKIVENSVIYGSTNVPLYTLIAQVMLVGSFSRNVWVRTPEATRDIYIRIFSLLKSYLPTEYTQNIHLVTDPSDLSYDMFNRIFVMGLNRNRTRSVRPPAELVILTGSPDTAREMIDRNVRNLEKISSSENQGQKQLFLGFLAGVNPAIIVPSAIKNMGMVVDKLTFPFLVNGGQDCMNSDIIFAHQGIIKNLQQNLLNRFKQMKMTSNEDRVQGITPLSMAKNLKKLIEYKEKYKKYLVTPNALLDEPTRRVAPHLFIIPYTEFSKLEIQEHFAPFMTIVTFESFSQLEQASMDPRLQKKAMAALVYGAEKMSPDVEAARDIFRKAQHSVFTNTHMYEELEMSMPFGGIGTETSMSVLAEMKSPGQVRVFNRSRPILISKEVESAFPLTKVVHSDSNVSTDSSLRVSPEHWALQDKTNQPLSMNEMSQVAQSKGLFLLVSGQFQNEKARLDYERLNGIKTATYHDNKKMDMGVLLHLAPAFDIEKMDTRVRGKLNPLLGPIELLKKFNQSKDEELRLVRSVDPEIMPGMHTFTESIQGQYKVNFEMSRKIILQKLIELTSHSDKQIENKVELEIYEVVAQFLSELRKVFPAGAYVKNFGEFASGDIGNSVTTFSASPKQIVKEFMLWFKQTRSVLRGQSFTSQDFQDYLTQRSYANSTRFVNQLLLKPELLLVQERIDIAETHLGAPMEFRVDFIQGQPVLSRMRFGFEYYPEELKMAEAVVASFMRKAPSSIQTLSGGADVALTRDGRWIIFEFNFGSASGTLRAGYYPFEANQIFSKMQGRDTWLISEGLHISAKTSQEQNQFLRSLKHEKPIWWKTSVDDISQVEWAKWLRDAYLERWLQSSNKSQTAEKVLADIRILLNDLGSVGNLDFQRMYESTEYFVKKQLLR